MFLCFDANWFIGFYSNLFMYYLFPLIYYKNLLEMVSNLLGILVIGGVSRLRRALIVLKQFYYSCNPKNVQEKNLPFSLF